MLRTYQTPFLYLLLLLCYYCCRYIIIIAIILVAAVIFKEISYLQMDTPPSMKFLLTMLASTEPQVPFPVSTKNRDGQWLRQRRGPPASALHVGSG